MPADARNRSQSGARLWPAGTPVEVRNRFNGHWARGFEVAGVTEGEAYEVRRKSDSAVLPGPFDPQELRPQRDGS